MFSEELKTLRSDFLVHWTGAKDIEVEYRKNGDEKLRQKTYVDRLCTTLDLNNGGLWMNDVDIELRGLFNNFSYIRTIPFTWPATCFTEIKLSQSQKHAERYGRLGFGFTRQFVMDRDGAPVQYVPGDKESMDSRNLGIISPHLLKLYEVLVFLALQIEEKIDPFHVDPKPILSKFLESLDFKQFLKDKDYTDIMRDPCKIFDILGRSVITVAIFVKRMSDEKCKHKFELLDEAEWRIPYTTTDNPRVKPSIERLVPNEDIYSSNKNPIAKIPFYNDDLKILIFPDDETRRIASETEFFQCWLKNKNGFPIMATVDECTQF
ncbi:MAG: hypothetical protein QG588_2211 [Candidatus Poribacteria bacterium]|nr:hypothetical protein [Candidatus Poribacteria bacterium]